MDPFPLIRGQAQGDDSRVAFGLGAYVFSCVVVLPLRSLATGEGGQR
jgi:hypothetical protein